MRCTVCSPVFDSGLLGYSSIHLPVCSRQRNPRTVESDDAHHGALIGHIGQIVSLSRCLRIWVGVCYTVACLDVPFSAAIEAGIGCRS